MVSAVLNAYPHAAREQDAYGRTPLHEICKNNRASLEMVSAVLNAYPHASRGQDHRGRTPLHEICGNSHASLEIVQKVLDEWLKTEENRSAHSVNSVISNIENVLERIIRGDIKELLFRLSSLLERNTQNNQSLKEIMTHFINTNWWNGVWLVIKMYPSVFKTLHLQTETKAFFLFTAGKRLSLASVTELIKNEPDLLEGV
eukprot:6981658-Ditylum_brightwellii.AAC.1